ncbi:MAG: hypothetical protein IID41_18480 [Planctomycetes bacterium]|nr:hypothetical protein [Planctomycetota bacterium]
MDKIIGSIEISGRVRAGRVYPQGGVGFTKFPTIGGHIELPGRWVPEGDWEENLTLFGWGTIVGELLRGAPDGKPYNIGAILIEFENNGGAAVSPPVFDRTGGKSYYDGLSSSGDRDYLRVPISNIAFTSSDVTKFPGGNQPTFYAQTAGIAGVHGKTFSDGVQSRVFGGALVATPEFSDETLDIVHSRFYFAEANQLIKQAGSQVSLTWPLTLN